jgi:hypothetical protein
MCFPFFFANWNNKVQAVRVNPQGFILSEKRPRFETIMISQNDLIFSRAPSSLSEVMGIRVVGRPLGTVDGSMSPLGNTNRDALHLFRCCVVNKIDDTAASQRDWDREFGQCELPETMGPMVLARSDRGALHILHAMALLSFAENVMSPLFDDYQQDRKLWRNEKTHFEHQRLVITRRLDIASKADRIEFEKFWRKFKQERVDGHPELLNSETAIQRQMELWLVNLDELEPHPEWASVPSPYDVTDQTRRLSIGR